MAGRGAALAVRRALALAGPRAGDPAGWLRLVFSDVRQQLTVLASADGKDVADYATTLAVAVLTDHLVGVGQIGDTIAVLGLGERYETVAPAPRGEYLNETTFITEQRALGQLRVTVRPVTEVDAVFLATDGLRFKILDDLAASTPYAPFFGDVAAYARSGQATGNAVRRFLADVDDQSGDDKTLVAAVRVGDVCRGARQEQEHRLAVSVSRPDVEHGTRIPELAMLPIHIAISLSSGRQ
jgi:hypothetical protein